MQISSWALNQANCRFPNSNYKRLRAKLAAIFLGHETFRGEETSTWQTSQDGQSIQIDLGGYKKVSKIMRFSCIDWTVIFEGFLFFFLLDSGMFFFGGGSHPKNSSNFQWWKWIQVLRFRGPEHLLFTRGPLLQFFFFCLRFLQGGSGNEWAISILRIHCGWQAVEGWTCWELRAENAPPLFPRQIGRQGEELDSLWLILSQWPGIHWECPNDWERNHPKTKQQKEAKANWAEVGVFIKQTHCNCRSPLQLVRQNASPLELPYA